MAVSAAINILKSADPEMKELLLDDEDYDNLEKELSFYSKGDAKTDPMEVNGVVIKREIVH